MAASTPVPPANALPRTLLLPRRRAEVFCASNTMSPRRRFANSAPCAPKREYSPLDTRNSGPNSPTSVLPGLALNVPLATADSMLSPGRNGPVDFCCFIITGLFLSSYSTGIRIVFPVTFL